VTGVHAHIHSLFSDAASNSDYILLNEWIMVKN
jgi:hypothetical protein